VAAFAPLPDGGNFNRSGRKQTCPQSFFPVPKVVSKVVSSLQRAREAYCGVTDRNLKLAILLAHGADVTIARMLLETHRGHLRPVFTALGYDT
jgi:hypothetical protein